MYLKKHYKSLWLYIFLSVQYAISDCHLELIDTGIN